jgi:flagellin
MTRINTNVSSSIAQSNLARSHASLQVALQRLSTGLRINVGKDDPAGLIASEVLRSDITSIERAISNSERANQLIATADSALGQVSSLLNDIRGLISDAANTGALSQEQIEANQLQLDSSLEAIDRISQTTSFQGKKLLDGSLDFTHTNAGNLPTQATASIAVTAGALATTVLSAGGANNDLLITAKAVGTTANGYSITVTAGATGSGTINVSATSTGVEIQITGSVTAANVAQALSANTTFGGLFSVANNGADTGLGVISADNASDVFTSAGSNPSALNLTAVTGGTGPNSYTISLTAGAAESATLSGNNFLITLTAGSTNSTVSVLINASNVFTAAISGTPGASFSAGSAVSSVTGGGSGGANISDLQIDQANFGTQSSIAVEIEVDTQATQGQLTYSGGALSADLVLEVGGSKGFEVFNFGTGNTAAQIRDAINLVSDATGVSASLSGTDLVFRSAEYGTDAFVQLRALSGTFTTYDSSSASVERDAGSDVAARINGIVATGKGLQASINTSTLDISLKLNSGLSAGDTVNFTITGGGAQFQLGPDVVSTQQARLGIQGVSTATLGGADGTLFELRTGGNKALETDVKGAALVVDQVITKVTSLRGRLGAFQRTTLETNVYTLTDTLQALLNAQSSIRDADFAKETASLTRSQILVQAGTTVLAIANQSPQQVLALLQ